MEEKQKKNYAAGSNHCAGRRSFCGWIRSGCEQRAYYEYLWESRKQINEELGINVPKLIYKPEGMTYESYAIDDKIQRAKMQYLTKDQKCYYIYMNKKAVDTREVMEIDGKVIAQHLLNVEYLEKGVKVEQMEEENGQSLYKADFYYDDVYYLLIGEMEKEEFDEIIKKMIF